MGIWIVPRFADVRAGLRDHERLSSGQSQSRFRVALPMMIAKDPPDHTRLRQLVSRAFTPRALAVWQALVEQIADHLVERMITMPDPDGVRDLAQLLPTRLIAEMFAIPEADHARFRDWSTALIDGSFVEVGRRTVGVVQRMVRATFAMRQYVRPLIEQRRRDPGSDLISLMTLSEDDDSLGNDEVFWGVVMLIVAGNETTTNLLAGLLHTFALRPDIYETLRDQPGLIPAAIEEQLRMESPVQGFYRTATVDYPVEHYVIPRQSRVLLLFGAANRDPRHFDQPNSFRLDRDPAEHLSFGGGIHYCLGAHLSRLEARQVVSHLTQRVAAVELAGPPRRLHNATMHGFTRLPLRLVPA
ncbi:cytochrome P450 [Mycobacterium sp.]|uniref:cytochrome P450 n=1 Tax=Mycobacterium sp. TaxID=1785 RepID=UPI002D22E6FA|nr:cytochrome P450 [Mycobacterium sp.]HZA08851.1 cytochrome P450 [Mycobacterium sp.]